MPLKAVLFDLDGTLLDTAPDFVITLEQLAEEYQVKPVSKDRIRQTVSNGARALTTLLFDLTEDQQGFEERRQRLLDIYYEHMGKHCEPFEGIIELLQQCATHQLDWGIVTNKPVRFAEPIIKAIQFPKPPAVLICPDHVDNTKPNPEPLIKACERLNCQPEDIIYIGDHQRDIDCGLNAGCETIAVSFGYLDEQDNIHDWNAHHIVDHSREIWPILTNKF